MTRPVVHCLVARSRGEGEIGRCHVVDLQTAYLAKLAGWMVIGPDPHDVEALAEWDRDHR
jgi:hypothetical protein